MASLGAGGSLGLCSWALVWRELRGGRRTVVLQATEERRKQVQDGEREGAGGGGKWLCLCLRAREERERERETRSLLEGTGKQNEGGNTGARAEKQRYVVIGREEVRQDSEKGERRSGRTLVVCCCFFARTAVLDLPLRQSNKTSDDRSRFYSSRCCLQERCWPTDVVYRRVVCHPAL